MPLTFLDVLYLPSLSPVIDFRAYAHETEGFSVLGWLIERMAGREASEGLIVLFHDDADRKHVESRAGGKAIAFQTVYPSKLAALADLSAAFPQSHIAVFRVEIAFAPSELLPLVCAHHEGQRNHCTFVEGLPAAMTPEIYSPGALSRLARLEPVGLPPDNSQSASGLRSFPFRASDRYGDLDATAVKLSTVVDATRAAHVLGGLPRTYRGEALERWKSAAVHPNLQPDFDPPLGDPDSRDSHVLYVSFPSGYSGAEVALCQLARDLKGFRQSAVLGVEGLFARRMREAGCSVACANWSFIEENETSLEFARNCIRSVRPSLLHLNAYSGEAFLKAAAEFDLPLVLHLRTGDPRTFETAYSQARTVIAVSGFVRQALMQTGVGDDKIEVVYDGVDLNAFRPDICDRPRARQAFSIPPEVLTVTMVARIIRLKRHDLLLGAFADLLASGLPVRLLLAADQPNTEWASQIRQQVRDLGLQDFLTWIPFQSDVRPVLAASDVVVLSSDGDALSMSVLEAMAMEVPVIVTQRGGTAELVDPDVSGLVVPSGDRQALASALVRVASDHELRRYFGLNARKRASDMFSAELHASNIARIFREVSRSQRFG